MLVISEVPSSSSLLIEGFYLFFAEADFIELCARIMIDQPTIDRILDAAQIVDVVSDFVTLRKRGVNYVGLCPFHDDKTPSFYVSPAKGLCKCLCLMERGQCSALYHGARTDVLSGGTEIPCQEIRH